MLSPDLADPSGLRKMQRPFAGGVIDVVGQLILAGERHSIILLPTSINVKRLNSNGTVLAQIPLRISSELPDLDEVAIPDPRRDNVSDGTGIVASDRQPPFEIRQLG
ncbi:hypothetical protein [Allorhodopirellula solitaria]|uniref:hypothetical protein n=1 Tax=Allorhodopirellula solitaria TaxID=2527987 RepID=UPI001C9792AA|nr:hypothetical protein [Allorhodopirellula solitaria]